MQVVFSLETNLAVKKITLF